MTAQAPESQVQDKTTDKELNFRNLEAKYQRQLAEERAARQDAERRAQEASRMQNQDDDDSEPYVDHKKLDKKLARFGEQSKEQTKAEIQQAVQQAIYEERKNIWLKGNPDFYETLKNENLEKFANHDPELADTILQMPDNFERQKLVYKNIKALGIDKPAVKQPSIQDKVDANRKSPYYQPSGVGTAPYQSVGDYSAAGQKNAYDKMQDLKNRLRL